MHRKSRGGDADLNRTRDFWYWRRIERQANTVVDVTLANRSICRRAGAATAASSAPLIQKQRVSVYPRYVGPNREITVWNGEVILS